MSKTVAARPTDRLALTGRAMLLLLAVVSAALLCPTILAQTSAYVPAMVTSSVSPVPTTLYDTITGSQTNLKAPTEVAVDACGNIYTLDHGYDGNAPITKINPGGGPASVVYIKGNSYAVHMGQDPTYTNLLIGADYSPHVNLIPVVGCVPIASQATQVGGSGNGALYYYYNPSHLAGDFAGNTYITTNGTCCVTGNYYLVKVVKNTATILLANQPKELLSLAIDKLQNVYFITDGAVYELPYSGALYAKVPVSFGKYINPVGLSVDSAGNLYVADSSAGAIYEIPNEGTTGPNLADQFTVSSGLNINVAVAVNARGDMYYTASGAAVVTQLTLGNANFNAVASGQSATRVLNFQFNALSTLTSIQAPGGDFTIQPPAPGTTACTTPTPYGPAGSRSNCQVTVGFKPTTIGKQSSAVVITYTTAGPPDKNGKPTTLTVTSNAFVEGIGQGALLTLDPGTTTPAGSGLKTPAGAAVDHAGNAFVADPGNNAVVEYPAGGGAAVSVGTGITPALAAPTGVAVDGAGDVFIADTGNNRVVEVPFVSGALSPAASTVVASGLKSPASVYVHTTGDLYVADTGDNTILVYPSFNGPTNSGAAFGAPTKLGVGLLAPLAVTVDGPGNVYIADSGNNQILEYPLGGGQEIVAANILNPSGLATDSSGSLFVVDQGNFRVLRIPSVQGTLSPNSAVEVGLGVAAPYGVAVDASSNLYVTDKANGAAYTIARSQISLNYGNLAVGVASTALPLTIESAGNLPLAFNSPYFTETGNVGDFAMTSPTGACADGLTLPAGTTCDLAATFTPTVAGSRSAKIAFASNASNAPQVTETGTGVSPSPTTTTLALIPSVPGAPFYGEPLSATATVAPTSGTGTPTGLVAFVVDGTQAALLPVIKGVATLQLNSGLTGGVHSIYAVYKGDLLDNGSSSVLLPVTISRAPTTPVLTVTQIPFNNPYSLRHSNTGSCSVTDSNGYQIQYPAVPNDGIGFTATVTSPGIGVPSGKLTFFSDGKLLNGPPDPKTGLPSSVTPLLPQAGGIFLGTMTSDANTLGDGTTLGENNVLIGPHNITVVYSGDQNYLPSTSAVSTVTVTDVSPTTPVTLPQIPLNPPPYCDASSTIVGSRPSYPTSYAVAASSTTITASANAPGTTTLTFSSLGGWSGNIDITCPDLPQYTTCSANPGTAVITPSSPGSSLLPLQIVLTVTTNVPPLLPTATLSGYFWPASVVLGLLMIAGRRRFRKATGGLTIAGFALLLFAGIAGFSGCGTNTTPSVVTKPGSYPITVQFVGSQYGGAHFDRVSQADLPYKMAFTLNVK